MNSKYPNFEIENKFSGIIAGIDEAGRGPIAGPVVAACAILDRNSYPLELNDSKKISKLKRERIFLELQSNVKFGVGIVNNNIIDEINILNATKLAMKIAYEEMCKIHNLNADLVIVDGNFIPNIKTNCEFVIKGDQKSLSIAAASIIAKVTRDNIMSDLDRKFPNYGWAQNQAYPTKAHIESLEKFGICEYHRKSFAPVKKLM